MISQLNHEASNFTSFSMDYLLKGVLRSFVMKKTKATFIFAVSHHNALYMSFRAKKLFKCISFAKPVVFFIVLCMLILLASSLLLSWPPLLISRTKGRM